MSYSQAVGNALLADSARKREQWKRWRQGLDPINETPTAIEPSGCPGDRGHGPAQPGATNPGGLASRSSGEVVNTDTSARKQPKQEREHSSGLGDAAHLARETPHSREARALSVILPLPPSVNDKAPGWWLDGQTQFRREVASIIAIACKDQYPISGRMHAAIVFFPSNPRSDCDNRVKPLFDALQHAGVFANDNRIKHFSVDQVDGTGRDECLITVWSMPHFRVSPAG